MEIKINGNMRINNGKHQNRTLKDMNDEFDTIHKKLGGGMLNAGATIDIHVPNGSFGILMCRVWRSYMEVTRIWAISLSSRWAQSSSLLVQHNYVQGGTVKITYPVLKDNDVYLRLENTSSNEIYYTSNLVGVVSA